MAQFLIAPLCNFFRSVREARSFSDLRASVAKHRVEVVILDLEMASIPDVEGLCHDFPGIHIVCNHRVADEGMWAAILNAGAADCYPSHDTRGILTAALRNAPMVRSQVA
jgi:DNA-binding NarL/FixJ family response regulator